MPAARKTKKPNNPAGKQRRLDRASKRVKTAHTMSQLGVPQKGSNRVRKTKLLQRYP